MRDLARLSTNARIAAALLDVLGTSGDMAGRSRALHVAGDDGAALRAPGWIREDTLRAMLHAVGVDARLARRVGQALVTPAALGFPLWYRGVATPEKAYRRCDQLLARESRGGRYRSDDIGDGKARIVFEPAQGLAPEPLYCEIRAGMLEAIPLLFGLLPAHVCERECSQRGAAHCVFELRFSRASRTGLWLGAGLGALLGPAVAWGIAAGLGILALPLGALGLGVLAAAAGRSLDLARQLEAVAGARRGQLALLDQADRTLAEKMDQLAKLDTALEASVASGRSAVGASSQLSGETIRDTLEERSREARQERSRVDLEALAERVIASLREGVPNNIAIALEVEPRFPRLGCEPGQIEEALTQLLRNSVNAMPAGGCLTVSLACRPEGLELAVADRGPGIPSDILERLFDPFTASPVAGVECGLGLPLAQRIAAAHQGELRIESPPEGGSRVSLMLPRDSDGDPPARTRA